MFWVKKQSRANLEAKVKKLERYLEYSIETDKEAMKVSAEKEDFFYAYLCQQRIKKFENILPWVKNILDDEVEA